MDIGPRGDLGGPDRQGARASAARAHPAAPGRARRQPGRSRHRARRPARRRLLPRTDAARLRLRRARAHGAAPRRAAALLQGHRAPEPRRGAVAHAADEPARRADRRDDPELVDDLAASADAGSSTTRSVVLKRTPLELDEQGFKKLNKLLAKTHEQALAIAAESPRANDGARTTSSPPSSRSCTSSAPSHSAPGSRSGSSSRPCGRAGGRSAPGGSPATGRHSRRPTSAASRRRA